METYILLTQYLKLAYTRELHQRQILAALNMTEQPYFRVTSLIVQAASRSVDQIVWATEALLSSSFGTLFLNFCGMWRSYFSTIFTLACRDCRSNYSSYRVALLFLLLLLQHVTNTHIHTHTHTHQIFATIHTISPAEHESMHRTRDTTVINSENSFRKWYCGSCVQFWNMWTTFLRI